MDPSGMRPENIIALMSTHKIAFQVDHGGCGQVAVHEFFWERTYSSLFADTYSPRIPIPIDLVNELVFPQLAFFRSEMCQRSVLSIETYVPIAISFSYSSCFIICFICFIIICNVSISNT